MRWYPTDGNLNIAQTQFYYGDQTSSVCFFSFGLLLKKKKKERRKNILRSFARIHRWTGENQLANWFVETYGSHLAVARWW